MFASAPYCCTLQKESVFYSLHRKCHKSGGSCRTPLRLAFPEPGYGVCKFRHCHTLVCDRSCRCLPGAHAGRLFSACGLEHPVRKTSRTMTGSHITFFRMITVPPIIICALSCFWRGPCQRRFPEGRCYFSRATISSTHLSRPRADVRIILS